MKLNSLKITNVLGIESLNMDLTASPITLIVGENESGKSSIRDSIQLALTGQARGMKKHEDQANLIREGAKFGEVVADFDGKEIIWRKTPKVAATRTGPVPEDAVMATILADPLMFLSMEDKARREILFRLIPGLNPKRDEIRARLIVELKGLTGALTPQMDSDILNLANIAEQKGFAVAESEAIADRRIAKRTRDDAQVQEPETKATIGGVIRILPDIQAADVEAGLTTIRTERDKLQQKRGKVEAQADKLPELEQELAEMVSNPVDPPDPDYSVTVFTRTLEINRGILEKCRAKVAAMTEGADPKNFPALCPVHNIGCPSAGKEAVKGTKPKDVDPMALSLAQANLAEQEREVGLIETDLAAARLAQASYDDYCKQKQTLESKIAKAKEQQAQAVDVGAIDEQITAMNQRMKTGYELLDAVRDFWRKKDAADAATAKVEQAEKEIALYDALAKALAPSGIPSELIREALGPVNERLAMASGYLFPDFDEHAPLHLSEDLEVYRGVTPFALLSKSARYRAGIAFQVCLAQLAGARLMLIDEADLLDITNRANLVGFLLAIKEDFDCILCFATSDHADPSPDPSIQVWWLDNGHIEQVNEKKAA